MRQDLPPTDSGYAAVNGLNMYYEVYGQGLPLVLLHGSFLTIPLNRSAFLPLLAPDRQLIVPELQGHGRTRDIPRAVSYEGLADDVAGLLQHLHLERVDMLGLSMGGGVAFQFAVRHPQRLRRLVVLSAPYAHNGWWPEVEASFATFTAEQVTGTAIQQEYERWGNDPAQFSTFIDKVIRLDLQPYDWTEQVTAIQAPLFLALGDADGVRYEHALALFRAKGGGQMGDLHGLPHSRLAIMPGTTHVGMLQRAAWLVPMITEFLDTDFQAPPPTF